MVERPVALVTGGSRGIGAATCRALARDGYQVVFNYQKSQELADALAREIDGTALCADLSDDAAIARLFEALAQKFGRLDALVNNAGIAPCEALPALTRAAAFQTWQVNLWAPMLCLQKAVPLMKTGAVVFISSTSAHQPTPDALAYAASKAGLEAVMRSVAKELAPAIRVNAVAPSATETDMMRANYSADDVAWVKAHYPLQRPCAPADIAEMVAFLLSPKACSITGQTYKVDAGASLL